VTLSVIGLFFGQFFSQDYWFVTWGRKQLAAASLWRWWVLVTIAKVTIVRNLYVKIKQPLWTWCFHFLPKTIKIRNQIGESCLWHVCYILVNLFQRFSEFVTWRRKAVTFRKVVIFVIIGDDGKICLIFYHGEKAVVGQGLLTVEDSWLHSVRYTTLSRTPLDEWSARRKDLYLRTHNPQKRQNSRPPGGIRNRNPSKRAGANTRLIPHEHWDR
jgi:hypothetical protein